MYNLLTECASILIESIDTQVTANTKCGVGNIDAIFSVEIVDNCIAELVYSGDIEYENSNTVKRALVDAIKSIKTRDIANITIGAVAGLISGIAITSISKTKNTKKETESVDDEVVVNDKLKKKLTSSLISAVIESPKESITLIGNTIRNFITPQKSKK